MELATDGLYSLHPTIIENETKPKEIPRRQSQQKFEMRFIASKHFFYKFRHQLAVLIIQQNKSFAFYKI